MRSRSGSPRRAARWPSRKTRAEPRHSRGQKSATCAGQRGAPDRADQPLDAAGRAACWNGDRPPNESPSHAAGPSPASARTLLELVIDPPWRLPRRRPCPTIRGCTWNGSPDRSAAAADVTRPRRDAVEKTTPGAPPAAHASRGRQSRAGPRFTVRVVARDAVRPLLGHDPSGGSPPPRGTVPSTTVPVDGGFVSLPFPMPPHHRAHASRRRRASRDQLRPPRPGRSRTTRSRCRPGR